MRLKIYLCSMIKMYRTTDSNGGTVTIKFGSNMYTWLQLERSTVTVILGLVLFSTKWKYNSYIDFCNTLWFNLTPYSMWLLFEFIKWSNSTQYCHSAAACDLLHYNKVIMSVMTSQITSLTIVYSTVNSGRDKRKHQSFTSLAFVRGIHQWPVNSPHKGPVRRKMFWFDDVIMIWCIVSTNLVSGISET